MAKKKPKKKKGKDALDHINDLLLKEFLSAEITANPDDTILDSNGTSETNGAYGYSADELALLNTVECKGMRYGDRLAKCASNAVVGYLRSHCSKIVKPIYWRCGLKICPVCSRRRQVRLIEQFLPLVKTFKSPYFMTLTHPRSLVFDRDVLQDRHRSWRSLVKWLYRHGYPIAQGLISREVTHALPGDPRRYKEGRKVIGTYTEENAGFLYHSHVLYDGPEIPKDVLREKWLELTGDSSIVDIRPVTGDTGAALAYKIKYMSKDNEIRDVPSLVQFLNVTKNRHAIRTFGLKTPKKAKLHYYCTRCHEKLTSLDVRKLVIQSIPKEYAVTYDFPFYCIPASPQDRQQLLERAGLQRPTEFLTGLEAAFLRAFEENESLTYEELTAIVTGEELDDLLAKHLEAGNIFEAKLGTYRRPV